MKWTSVGAEFMIGSANLAVITAQTAMAGGRKPPKSSKKPPKVKAIKGAGGAKSVGNPVPVAGKGNTGRVIPNTVNEQMAMHQVQSSPLEGASKLPIKMSDTRWPASEGWTKMQSVVRHADGSKTTIHYVYNEVSGVFDDFKFK
jgi:hypothetical protein